jgi:hypothetical protein
MLLSKIIAGPIHGRACKPKMKSEPQYIEGQQARKNFEQTMTALFRAPKQNPRKQRKTATLRKPRATDKD